MINDPLDISVCAEFLSPKTDRVVLRSVLHLIAALSGNQRCAAIFAGRKEVSSLFAKREVVADTGGCGVLLNVIERFTFYDQRYAPEKFVSAMPGLLKSPERAVQRSVLHIVCQIAIPDHAFLLRDGIPQLVIEFAASADATICYLALRGIGQLIVAFQLENNFFGKFQGKERILELVRGQTLCRAVVSALSALVQRCLEFTEKERAQIGTAIRGLDGLGNAKPVTEPIDALL
jgi:hypothetical protein